MFCSSLWVLELKFAVLTVLAELWSFLELCSLATEYLLAMLLWATERVAQPPSFVGVLCLSRIKRLI